MARVGASHARQPVKSRSAVVEIPSQTDLVSDGLYFSRAGIGAAVSKSYYWQQLCI